MLLTRNVKDKKVLNFPKDCSILNVNRKKFFGVGLKSQPAVKVRDLPLAADPVQFRNRQYSLDERRNVRIVRYLYLKQSIKPRNIWFRGFFCTFPFP